jgi:predicted pyridoxine 5'-phosphate oxidase superfamily flavin-nucleotide-binding protein
MAKLFDAIDEHLARWITAQRMFFVGTAPLTADGHVNVSPKGPIESLRVLGPREAAYLDANGSGNETIAHVRENGRIVVMLCAFEGPPKIVRLHGRAEVVLPGDPRFAALLDQWAFEDLGPPEARRSIVRIDVERISDSCGYGVPLMGYEGRRPHYGLSVDKKVRTKGAENYAAMARERGAESIDGLPALPQA